VKNLTVVPGTAPDACVDLPVPTHVFIGGSSGNMKEIIALLLQKNPKVRIVATAIALESIAELTDCLKFFAFEEAEVVSMTVARNRKAGPYNLMTGQNPIYIFTMQGGKL
jgi:precorrin-6Y C5,15-methyltransferase (decarboxylating)